MDSVYGLGIIIGIPLIAAGLEYYLYFKPKCEETDRFISAIKTGDYLKQLKPQDIKYESEPENCGLESRL